MTFNPARVGYFDFETASGVDIDAGAYAYMAQARPLIIAIAVGAGGTHTVPFPCTWSQMPAAVREHQDRVAAGEAVWAAWNAAFDREAWNQLTDFPLLRVEHVIDVAAQAAASGLPGALDGAGRALGLGRKQEDGRKLIRLFNQQNNWDSPALTAERLQFCTYAAQDVELLRGIFLHTLQLPLDDWRVYWANERINLRGIAFDDQLAEAAARLAAADRLAAAGKLRALTDGAVTSVTQVARITKWLICMLSPADRALLTRFEREEEDEDTGETVTITKHGLSRNRVEKLLAKLDNKPTLTAREQRAKQVLELRHYGGSTTPAKFAGMLASRADGLLCGQFVFNGAGQTGRFSSRGVQLHNLKRDALPYEPQAIEQLCAGCSPDAFEAFGEPAPVAKKLSMLIRPTLVPEHRDNAFVWGDWSQIEARVMPWLAGDAARLAVFQAVDRDPELPDLYTRTAAAMSNLPIEQVTKELRQRGKVTELACQYGGGRGALQSMAAGYGMHLDDDAAQEAVGAWRGTNPWAVDYWDLLWRAFLRAIARPRTAVSAGRVVYLYYPEYLGGSMFCQLPSQRTLVYRRVRHERVTTTDAKGNITVSEDKVWTFSRGFGRVKLWHGILAENITQAVAADVLRGALVRAQDPALDLDHVRAHTHDEILLEVAATRAESTAAALVALMERPFDWSDGLPLKAEATLGYAYSKCPAAQGL